jgi:metal-responsive CopG/Arc/MetJ family transcriptional regulator
MITVFFDAEQKGLKPALVNIQNEYREIIHTSFNARMNEKTDLEIILVRGDSTRIRSLEQKLGAKRGIQSARLTLIPS